MALAKRTELGAPAAFEYAPAPEATDHVRIASRYDLFIGGKFVRAHSRRRFATVIVDLAPVHDETDVPLLAQVFGQVGAN